MNKLEWGILPQMALCLLVGCAGPETAEPPADDGAPWAPRVASDAGAPLDGAEAPVEDEPPMEGTSGEEPPADSGDEPSESEAPVPGVPDDGLAALQPLPAEMAGLRWPEAPRITREVVARSAAELASAVRVAGTRVRVLGAVGGSVGVPSSDVEILSDDATSLGTLSVARGVSRVRVVGGAWTSIQTAIPAQFGSSVQYRDEWMVQDVLIEGVRVRSGDTAFAIRGRRIAIVRSQAWAERYSVWCGDVGPLRSEDIILHQNDLRSAGPEPTVRLVQLLRSATVDNRLSNTFKHNYRVHGTSDLNYAGRNLLVGTGTMLGRMPGDDLGRVWFDDNVLHHDAPDLFNPEASIDALHATGNIAYTNVWSCFFCGGAASAWTIRDNVIRPYRPAP